MDSGGSGEDRVMSRVRSTLDSEMSDRTLQIRRRKLRRFNDIASWMLRTYGN